MRLYSSKEVYKMAESRKKSIQKDLKIIEGVIESILEYVNKGRTKKARAERLEERKEDLEIAERAYRKARSEIDVLYFAYEYFSDERNPDNDNNLIPLGATLATAPAIHKELCDMLNRITFEEHDGKVCWSVPRGHAKSTYVSNIYPIHCCIFDGDTPHGRKYILIISETEDLAKKFIEYIKDQLKHNKKLREDFGELLSTKKFENEKDNASEFVTTKGTLVRAGSTGKALRGARNKAYRPDLVICDDLESMENTNTPELREKNLYWFNSVVSPVGEKGRTAFLYVGTMVHGQGLLPDVLTRIDYNSKIYSAIIDYPVREDLWQIYEEILNDKSDPNREDKADAFYYEHAEEMDEGVKTLWSERWTYRELMKEKSKIGSRAFSSEYLNLPADKDSMIFHDGIFTYYDENDLYDKDGRPRPMEIFGFWDLAIKDKKRSDYNAVVIIGRDKVTGVMYVLESWSGRVPVHKALIKCLEIIEKWQPKIMGVETIQAQYELYRQLQEKMFKLGITYTRLKPINPKAKKEERIEILEPLFETGFLRIKRTQRLLIEQLEQFPNGDHDDLPDALASAVDLAGKHSRRRTHYRKPRGM